MSRKHDLWNELKDLGVDMPDFSTTTIEELENLLREATAAIEAAEDDVRELIPEQWRKYGHVNIDVTGQLWFYETPVQRIDEFGRLWFAEEITQPGHPVPPRRRVERHPNAAVKEHRIESNDPNKSFEIVEVGGEVNGTMEVRVTLPTYQEAHYADPRFPFISIRSYAGAEVFDSEDSARYWGGVVPTGIKRAYAGGMLGYSIADTQRVIEQRANTLMMKGNVND